MGSKKLDPQQPTVYLDNSTLCDAFFAASDGPYRPLRAWIERVARGANLCLSLFHIEELSRWEDRAKVDAILGWYTSMNVVWLKSLAPLLEFEDDTVLRDLAGGTPTFDTCFARNFLNIFSNLSWEARNELLDPRYQLFRMAHAMRSPEVISGGTVTLDAARALRQDRAVNGYLAPLKDAIMARKQDEDARMRCIKAAERLQIDLRSNPRLSEKFVDLAISAPERFPANLVGAVFNGGFAGFVEATPGGSKKEVKRLRGTFADMVHAASGGAYCDIFTCDAATRSWIAGVRSRLGRSEPLVREKGNEQALVERLMASVPV